MQQLPLPQTPNSQRRLGLWARTEDGLCRGFEARATKYILREECFPDGRTRT